MIHILLFGGQGQGQERAAAQESSQGLNSIPLDAQVIPELAAIEARIEAEIQEKAEIPFETAMKALKENYSEALTREMDVLKNSGKLDAASALKSEIQDFASGSTVPATNDGDVPPELQRLRTTFRKERANQEAIREKRIQPVIESYNRETADLEFQLTKDGRIAEAKSIKKAAALFWIRRSKLATISCEGEIAKFTNGTTAFSSRSYAWANIPDYLPDSSFVRNAGGSAVARKIKVLGSGVIFVGADTKTLSDHEILEKLGFLKLQGGFNYSDAARSPMSLFARVVDRSIEIPPASGFGGFVIIGEFGN